ncbi:MAG TPA: hypothetical protein VKX41_11480 [Alloacidobacterium sp.]|nr:hypothetical protein [Alloacidobacterium sp.]
MTPTPTPTLKLSQIIHLVPATSRLCLLALVASTTPMTIGHLSEVTGSTPSTLIKVTRKLLVRGYLVRTTNGGAISLYAVAPHIQK